MMLRMNRFSAPYICSSCAKILHRQRRRYAAIANQTPEIYDVVCVGGGPAGLSLLTALRSSPITSSLKLALIESQDLSPASSWSLPSTQFSNRASSLTPSSKAFLEEIGAWPYLDRARIVPYHSMQVWDGVSGSRIEFDRNQHSRTPKSDAKTIAHMTENPNLVRALLTRLASLPPITTYDQTSVSHISLGPPMPPTTPSLSPLSTWPHVTLSTPSPTTLAARLLIGADGFSSPVRTFANIPSHGWDYDRHALVATVTLSSTPTASIAYQRFLPTGPIALLPLPGPYATLVWSTTPARAAHLKTLSATDLAAIIDAAFRFSPVDLTYMHTIPSGQLSELEWRSQHTPSLAEGVHVPYRITAIQPSSPASFPLRLRHADSYTGPRVALVGDAAHTIHPLAGQGLNMGLGDVETLARGIEYAVGHGMDIGDGLSLEGFAAERYGVNNRLLGVVDKLHKVYSADGGPVVWARGWGMEAVNSLSGVKEFFMRQAAGGKTGVSDLFS